ncbi:MAG TPA: hypothetical protein EYH02_04240 [Ignisphaera aggregans]|uniref:Sjogrens syndrome scleroderma autoantigen 1 n=1 Tax=Ignisphaera aggregans TaxID=334771 RepID=A0A833DTT8_9CREN|nr:hypothetical protein [Ignisphaera aggregans]
MAQRDAVIKKMVELMRSGATMLAETCPLCNAPLLRLPSGEVQCPIHGRVFVAKTEEEVAEASVLGVLTELEKTASTILSRYVKTFKERNPSAEDLKFIIHWLDVLERIERIKTTLTQYRTSEKEKEKK